MTHKPGGSRNRKKLRGRVKKLRSFFTRPIPEKGLYALFRHFKNKVFKVKVSLLNPLQIYDTLTS